jgi:hypothetical protein
MFFNTNYSDEQIEKGKAHRDAFYKALSMLVEGLPTWDKLPDSRKIYWIERSQILPAR